MPRPRRGAWIACLLAGPLAWFALRLAARGPESVEAFYSRRLYPWLAAAVGALPGQVAFSVAEPLAAILFLVLAALAWRHLKRESGRRLRAAAEVALGLCAVASLLSAGLVGLFAFNASRLRVAQTLELTPTPRRLEDVEALAVELEAEAAVLRADLAEDARGVQRAPLRRALFDVGAGFAAIDARIGWPGLALPEPRPAWLSPLLTRIGTSGIYIPFTAEPLVNGGLPDHELPFTAAHELAHQRGFAREDEANFLAFLVCRAHPAPEVRYSAAMESGALLAQALWQAGEPGRAALRRVRAGQSEAMLRDRNASRAFWAVAQGPVFEAARRVNDTYIRSTGQPEGQRTYGLAVDLLLAWRAGQRAARDE